MQASIHAIEFSLFSMRLVSESSCSQTIIFQLGNKLMIKLLHTCILYMHSSMYICEQEIATVTSYLWPESWCPVCWHSSCLSPRWPWTAQQRGTGWGWPLVRHRVDPRQQRWAYCDSCPIGILEISMPLSACRASCGPTARGSLQACRHSEAWWSHPTLSALAESRPDKIFKEKERESWLRCSWYKLLPPILIHVYQSLSLVPRHIPSFSTCIQWIEQGAWGWDYQSLSS